MTFTHRLYKEPRTQEEKYFRKSTKYIPVGILCGINLYLLFVFMPSFLLFLTSSFCILCLTTMYFGYTLFKYHHNLVFTVLHIFEKIQLEERENKGLEKLLGVLSLAIKSFPSKFLQDDISKVVSLDVPVVTQNLKKNQEISIQENISHKESEEKPHVCSSTVISDKTNNTLRFIDGSTCPKVSLPIQGQSSAEWKCECGHNRPLLFGEHHEDLYRVDPCPQSHMLYSNSSDKVMVQNLPGYSQE